MLKLLFLLLSLTNTYTYADTKLEAGNVYELDTQADQVNLVSLVDAVAVLDILVVI